MSTDIQSSASSERVPALDHLRFDVRGMKIGRAHV